MGVEVVHADEVRARWPCHERTSGTTFAVELPNGGRVHLLMYDQGRSVSGTQRHAWGLGLKLAGPTPGTTGSASLSYRQGP